MPGFVLSFNIYIYIYTVLYLEISGYKVNRETERIN